MMSKTKFPALLILIIAVLFGPADTKADILADLKATSDAVNAICPMDLGVVGTLTSTKFETANRNFIYNFEIDPYLVTLEQMRATGEQEIKSNIKTTMSQSSFRPLLQLLVEANAQLCANFRQGSKTPILIVLSTADLRDMLNTKQSDQSLARQSVKNTVTTENSRCPQDLGNGIILTKASCVDNMVH